MDPHRAERISEALREELAELIEYELSDPRLGGVRVTAVLMGRGLRHAHVRIHLSDRESGGEALFALERARSYLRRELAARLRLYRVPELHFEADAALAGDRLPKLLRRIRKHRPKPAGPADKNR